MSSRELLEILEFLPATSAFKTATRRGDWSDEQYLQARLVNEVALSRADNSGYMPELALSPLERHAEQAVDEFRTTKHKDTLAQLQGKRR